ncbi:MAG: hypothetical protein HQ567_23345 [Candidatus Nealsonbacteria bacterium]|nr:hypothetical protein [Candidatus Nealsonbacteria bacterium]
MEDNESYDPLLGCVTKRLDDRARSGSSGTAPKSDADAQPPEALAEAIRDASHALNLHDVAAAGWLYWIVSSTVSDKISPEAFKQYRDILIEDAGRPSDPIEIMLIEQLALAHFSIGRLQIKACSIEVPKLAIAYADSATRLLGEFRRCSLALEEYRAKQAARKEGPASNDAVGKKASAAQNGRPRPSANGNGSANGEKKHADTELGNNGHGEMPEWLRKRMAYPTPNGSKLAAATAGNGKA